MATSIMEVQSPHYEEIKAVAGSALTGNHVIISGDVNYFPLVSEIVNGEEFAGIVRCPKVKAVKATGAVVAGALLYWDDTAKVVTTVATGNTLIGFAIDAAASADTHVYMYFDGAIEAAVLVEQAEPKILVFKVTADASTALPIAGLSEGDEIIGMSVICTAANASGTLVLEDGAGDDITDGVICAVDKVVTYAGTIDDAKSVLPASGAAIISVGGTAANTRGIVVITYIPA